MWWKKLVWNPSNCQCECDKSCDVGEYLDYGNCKCRKTLTDTLVEERTGSVDEVKIAKISLMESIVDENKCKSLSTIYIVLILIVFQICIEIATYFFLLQVHESW